MTKGLSQTNILVFHISKWLWCSLQKVVWVAIVCSQPTFLGYVSDNLVCSTTVPGRNRTLAPFMKFMSTSSMIVVHDFRSQSKFR